MKNVLFLLFSIAMIMLVSVGPVKSNEIKPIAFDNDVGYDISNDIDCQSECIVIKDTYQVSLFVKLKPPQIEELHRFTYNNNTGLPNDSFNQLNAYFRYNKRIDKIIATIQHTAELGAIQINDQTDTYRRLRIVQHRLNSNQA